MAAGYIVDYLNANYGYDLDKTVFDIANYDKKLYEDFFMGSFGKKMTIAKVEPDDFTLLYPKFDTQLSLEIPSDNLYEEGDFSICYAMSEIWKDYNSANPYGAFLYADRPVVKLRNSLAQDKHKILILKDSYVNSMAPFLSLAVSEIDILDLRVFNGSVETYIEKEQPELVLVAYNTDYVAPWQENWLFDFR